MSEKDVTPKAEELEVEAGASAVDKERSTFGDKVFHVVDTGGHIAAETTRIGMQGMGHLSTMMGHVTGGVVRIFRNGKSAFNAHQPKRNSDTSSSHTAA